MTDPVETVETVEPVEAPTPDQPSPAQPSAPGLALVCPRCGEPTALGDAFCEACGADLPPTTAPPKPDGADDASELADEDGLTAPTPVAAGPPCPSCGASGIEVVEGYCGVCGMKQPALRDHLEAEAAGMAAVTDRGKRHFRNEDAFSMAVADDGRVLAVVCDGVSSTVNPDAASQGAVDAALGVLLGGNTLGAAYSAARDAVLAVTWTPDPSLGAPSCTFLAAIVDGDHVELATLGDCRSMWLPTDGEPQTLTEDDSWAAEQIAAGMTPAEAYAGPGAHVITRWLGADADPTWEPRSASFTAPAPGRLLLCSDGLWNYAETAADVAAAAAGEPGDLLTTARRLVDFANDRGGSDNITVVLVDLPRPIAKGPAE